MRLAGSPAPPLGTASPLFFLCAPQFLFPRLLAPISGTGSMASPISQKLEEKLVCCICLELFRVPVTLPCGHNFCKRCISDHWDKQKQEPSGTAATYTCPECRRGFERCPELEKNVILDSVVELARDSEERGSGTGRCLVVPGELCRQHGRPLELYCEDERRCICCICTVRDCQRHRRVLFEEERAKKQVGDRTGVMGVLGQRDSHLLCPVSCCRGVMSLCVPDCPALAGRGAVQGDVTSAQLLPEKPGVVRSSSKLGKSSSTR